MIVVPLSDHPYYLWQALVQAVELKKRGLPATYLVYTQGKAPSNRLRNIMDAGLANWYIWQDWRTDKTYNAAMKPWLVGKWLSANPEYVNENLIIIDPDAIPLRDVFSPALNSALLGTNTDSYTGPAYLKSRNAWEPLCTLLGIDPEDAANYEGIGAQYITTGLTGEWWETVAHQSVKAYNLIAKISSPDTGYPVQAWCAEMYTTFLSAIRDGIQPVSDSSMSMVWANGHVSDWDTHGFYHNAGVSTENGRDFCKITHQNSPWGEELKVSLDSASSRYVDLINQTAEQHPDLIW